MPVSGSSVQAIDSPTGLHTCHERGSSLCAPERYLAAHTSVQLATAVAVLPASSAGHIVHAGTVCFPRPDCELSKIEPDAESAVRILGNFLHLSPMDRQMEVTLGALVSCQACELCLCKAVDEARRHSDVNGLSGAFGRIASETDTTQFL